MGSHKEKGATSRAVTSQSRTTLLSVWSHTGSFGLKKAFLREELSNHCIVPFPSLAFLEAVLHNGRVYLYHSNPIIF